MTQFRMPLFFFLALPLQLCAFAVHLVLVLFYPKSSFWIEALPLVYLGMTYLQWLFVAIFISWWTKKFRVPIIMHLPHLLSFLPLLRHIILAAEKSSADHTSLTLAWLHCVATHSFSLVAAWLWQVREGAAQNVRELWQKEKLPLLLYTLASLTLISLYAGLDFSFSKTPQPWAVGAIQLALNLAVTGTLLYRRGDGSPGGDAATARGAYGVWAAAAVFSITNATLLFDKGSSGAATIGVEAALAATSFTQLFTLFVFLLYRRRGLGREAY